MQSYLDEYPAPRIDIGSLTTAADVYKMYPAWAEQNGGDTPANREIINTHLKANGLLGNVAAINNYTGGNTPAGQAVAGGAGQGGLLSSATHSPNVVAGDTPDYFKLYADVAGLYETNNYGMSKKEYAAAHYQQHGKAEGRMPDTVYIAPNSTPGGGGGSKPGGGSTSSTSSTSSGGGSASSGGAASSAPVSFSVGAPSTPYKPYVAPAGSAGAAPYVTSQRAITALPGRDAYSGGARSAPAPQTPTPTTGANASGAPAMTPSKSTPSNPYGYAAGASPVAGQPIPPMPQPSTGMTDQQMQLQRQASMADQEMQRQRQASQPVPPAPQPSTGTGMLYQSVPGYQPQSSSGYGPGGPEGVFDDDFMSRPQISYESDRGSRSSRSTGQPVPEQPNPYLDTSRFTDFQGYRQPAPPAPPMPTPSAGGSAPMPQPSSPVPAQPVPPMPAPSTGMAVRPAISQPLPTAGAVAPPMPQPSTGGSAPMPQPSSPVAGQPVPPMPQSSVGTPEQEAMRSGRATPAQPTPLQPNTPPAANAVTLRNVNAAQETIEGRVGNLLGADAQGNYTNPVVRQAVDRAMQSFSGRGLLNSSMAQQAAFEAATAKAIEIAGPDAQTYFNQGRANQDASNVFARDAISNAHDKDKFDRQLEQSGSQFDRDFGLRGDQFNESKNQFGQEMGFKHKQLEQSGSQFDRDFGLRGDQFNESKNQFDRNIDLEGRKFNESQSQFDRDLELRGYQVNQSGSQFEKEFDLKTQTFNQTGSNFDKELTFKAQQAGVQAGFTQQEINIKGDQVNQNQVQFEASIKLQRDQLTQQGSQFNQSLENQQNEFKLTAADKKEATAMAHKYSLEISTNNAVHDSYNVYLRRLADIDGNKDLTAETKAEQKNSAGKDFDTYAEKMAPAIKLELGNRFSVKPEEKPGDKTPTSLLSAWSNDGSGNGL